MNFAPGVHKWALPPLVGAVLFTFVFPPLAALLLAFGLFALWNFRDPERHPPTVGIVAPADGKVSVVREEGDQFRVGVYMNALDVHVIRAPKKGYVDGVSHSPGANKPAFSKESENNERVDVDFGLFEVSLIAGWFARRIVPYVHDGDSVAKGDRLGHIAFGSRADVLLPPSIDRDHLLVEEGDSVRAGETVIAEVPDDDDV
ncbi:phosphatidylserine decarboxylase [Salinigranum rubrum]|uniref:Phosphatidylserine decarboxylase n=1 Tax=Salinigranum rubrum TaxID=755307 RepID=A0A2I8VNT0_9EURY|nr:protein sorting system archaetidylserine decarboxylase [Salinigranum rubrum]AUV83555.1 phosphatidylserine decarboxylase [Salinigranum rubrum]